MVDASVIDARSTPTDATIATLPADAAVVSVVTGCPATVTSPSGGNCKLGTDCPYKDGRCFCDGYHGGIPPEKNVDYSHWVCGKTKGRQDGCPDQIRAGAACRTAGQFCHPQEGMFCGPQFECANGHWEARVNNCVTIPRAPPRE